VNAVVAVVGLGYMGLPLVVEFGKHTRSIGFDIAPDRVARCRAGSDPFIDVRSAFDAPGLEAAAVLRVWRL